MVPYTAETINDTFFLPDFCSIRMVFAVVVVGELLAFLLVLSPANTSRDRWGDLALISLFIQWVDLSSVALLCACRRCFRMIGNAKAGVISFGLVLLVVAVLSESTYWLVQYRLPAIELHAGWHLDFLFRNLCIGAIVAAVALRYFYVQFQWRRNIESEARARIQALQSRIRPHFLFNSMNTIASLTQAQPSLAEQMLVDLADLFRVSLGDARIPVSLEREIEVCREYLRIEQQRLDDRLTIELRLDNLPSNALLPALSLQPLVENAIYHGIEPDPDGGVVTISGEWDGDHLVLEISNSVPRCSAQERSTGNQMALDNVRQRLEAFFGQQGDLRVESGGDGYVVRVSFPYVSESR